MMDLKTKNRENNKEMQQKYLNILKGRTFFCKKCNCIYIGVSDKQLEIINKIRNDGKYEVLEEFPPSESPYSYLSGYIGIFFINILKDHGGKSYHYEKVIDAIPDNKYAHGCANGMNWSRKAKEFITDFWSLTFKKTFEGIRYESQDDLKLTELYRKHFEDTPFSLYKPFGILIHENDVSYEDCDDIWNIKKVKIKDTVMFSKEIVDFEKKYGKINFVSYDELQNMEICPNCNEENFKSSFDKEFIYNDKQFNKLIVPIIDECTSLNEKNVINKEVEKYKEQIQLKIPEIPVAQKSEQFALTLYIDNLITCEKGLKILYETLYDQVNSKFNLIKESDKSEINKDDINFVFGNMINDTMKKIIDIEKQKKQLISLNVIYPKYLNFVALTSIYEYLMSGRCDALAGSTGAYNLYESELRANVIIDKMDIIVNKLDTIINNQYQLYTELNEIKQVQKEETTLLKNVVHELSNIKEINHNIEKLSSMTAYNTKQTAYYSKLNNKLQKDMMLLMIIK